MKTSITILTLFILQSSFATTYYVSSTGSDSNSGLTQVLPWKTLDKINATNFSAGDQILFKRGDKWYGKLVVSNSGSSGSPITYGTYGFGDAPLITGLKSVTSWTNLGSNIWQSASAVSTLPSCNIVIINDVNTAMGRTPNTGYWTYSSSTSSSITSTSLNASTTNWTGAQVVIKKERYVIDRATITSASGGTVNFTNPSSYNGHVGWGFFIQADARTLDTQNEWYYDASEKKLSVYSTSEPTSVQLATRDTLVYIVNKNYITFDGIKFTGANGQAFYLGNTKNLTIKNCSFDFNYNGIKGYQFGGASSNVLIDSCTFNHTNNDAISLPSEFAGATITHNSTDKTGLFEGLAASGQSRWGINTTGDDYTIQYNTVRNTGYVGIGFNGSDVLCDKNIVDSFCVITDDGGGLYTGNPQSGVVISDNIVLNGIGNDEGTGMTNNGKASGIYCDDNSSGMTILNNSIANVIFAGIFLHNANDIEVRGNTTYNCGIGLLVDADDASKYTTGIEVKGNTFVAKTTGTKLTLQDQRCVTLKTKHTSNDIPNFGNIDSNFYARPIDDNLTLMGTIYGVADYDYSLGTWGAAFGYDLNTNKSPTSVSNQSQLTFYSNPNNYDSTLSLGSSTYVDMANTSYTGDVVLPAYSSLTLINTGTLITPVISWSPASVTYPNGLGAGQLNAIAMDGATIVPGTHSYLHGTGYVGNVPGISNTDSFIPSDQLTYSTATKTVTIPVNPQSVSLAFSDTIKTYTGASLLPTLTATPNVSTSITLNGVTSGKINAGTYTAIGGVTDPNSTATSITASFTINKATATINAVNQEFNYDGLSHSISYTTFPSGLNVTHSYSSGTAPTEIGTYTDTLRMVENNYEAGEIVRTITIVENAAIIFISDTSKVYNGSPQGVTVTSDYSHEETYNGSATVPTNAGVYEVITTINDGVHVGADTATLTILPKQAILSYSKPENVQYGTLYSAYQQKAVADVAGTFIYSFTVGNIIPLGLNTISATFTPDSPNYSGGTVSSTVTSFPGNNSPEIYITPNYFKKRLN